MNKLSKEAKELVKNITYLEVYETLNHDGYDSHGPQSNIWDLFILLITGDKILHYHREDWFNGCQESYTLYEIYDLSENNEHKGYFNDIKKYFKLV